MRAFMSDRLARTIRSSSHPTWRTGHADFMARHEARAILPVRSADADYYMTVASMIPADLPMTRAMLSGPTARKVAVNHAARHGVMVLDNETAAILAESLAAFIALEVS